MNKMDAVEQGPADFFCKAPDSKHFRLRRLCVSVTAVELGRRVCVCVCVCVWCEHAGMRVAVLQRGFVHGL